jgi:chromosome segregation ATPase
MSPEGGAAPASAGDRVHELFDENAQLRREIAGLEGRIEALQQGLSAQDAADEHRRVELEVARADVADARAELREAQVRVEEWRRQVAEAREREAVAARRCEDAERERAAVIAVLGRRARKQLAPPGAEAD